MNVSKKILKESSMEINGGRKSTEISETSSIKLKAITITDRQRLRIPSYQYLLP